MFLRAQATKHLATFLLVFFLSSNSICGMPWWHNAEDGRWFFEPYVPGVQQMMYDTHFKTRCAEAEAEAETEAVSDAEDEAELETEAGNAAEAETEVRCSDSLRAPGA
jgi:predicted  nucleic acid-binding Zn-ribbon protein